MASAPDKLAPLRTIKDGDDVVAIVLRRRYDHAGLTFITPDDFPMQMGYMKHPRGHVIRAHMHNAVARTVKATMEALFVKRGKVRVDLYRKDRERLESLTLEDGDVIFLAGGGHGFEVLEETEIIEIKQGPYLGAKDKTLL